MPLADLDGEVAEYGKDSGMACLNGETHTDCCCLELNDPVLLSVNTISLLICAVLGPL